MKKWKLLTLIIHGSETLLCTKKIYPAPYIPYTGQIWLAVDNKELYKLVFTLFSPLERS